MYHFFTLFQCIEWIQNVNALFCCFHCFIGFDVCISNADFEIAFSGLKVSTCSQFN